MQQKGQKRECGRAMRRMAVVFLAVIMQGAIAPEASEADFITEEVILQTDELQPQTQLQQQPGGQESVQPQSGAQKPAQQQSQKSGQAQKESNRQSEQMLRQKAGEADLGSAPQTQEKQNIQEKQNMQEEQKTQERQNAQEKKNTQGFRVPSQAGDDEKEAPDQGENAENGRIEEVQQRGIQADEGSTVERKNSAQGQMLFWGMLFLCGSIFAGGVYRVSKKYGKRRSAHLLRW